MVAHSYYSVSFVDDVNNRANVPSQGSGTVAAARSSIENFTSTPFSMRDSGSAFMSQKERLVSETLLLIAGTAFASEALEASGASGSPFGAGFLLGRPRPSFFFSEVAGVSTARIHEWSADVPEHSRASILYQVPCGAYHGHPSSSPRLQESRGLKYMDVQQIILIMSEKVKSIPGSLRGLPRPSFFLISGVAAGSVTRCAIKFSESPRPCTNDKYTPVSLRGRPRPLLGADGVAASASGSGSDSAVTLRGRPRPRLGPSEAGGLGIVPSGYLRGRPRPLFSPV